MHVFMDLTNIAPSTGAKTKLNNTLIVLIKTVQMWNSNWLTKALEFNLSTVKP